MKAKKKLMASVCGLAVSMLAVSGARAELVSNGSFEYPTVPGGGFDSSVPTDWDVLGVTGNNSPLVSPSSIDHIGGYWQAAQGRQSLDMNGLDYGVIGQTLTTVVGQRYWVTFELSGNPDNGPLPKSLQVDIISNPPLSASLRPFAPVEMGIDGTAVGLDGVSSPLYKHVFLFSGPSSHANMNWQLQQFEFVADSTSEYLQFTSRTVGGSVDAHPRAFGPALDAVSVVPVPLPASVGIGFGMLAGFGALLGFRKQLSLRPKMA